MEELEDGNWTEVEWPEKRGPLYIVIPIFVVYVAIFVTGLVGNLSTCVVIVRNRHMRTATNYYLFSLAISDLLLLVTGLPQEMYYLWSRYPYVFGEAFCLLRGLAAETSANATVLTITAFTVERYVAICHPFLTHTVSGLSRAVRLVLVIWLVSLAFAIPQAMQFGMVGPDEISMCYVKRILIEHSFELSTIFFFIVPMTLISILYALIGLDLRKASKASSLSADKRRLPSKSPSSRRVLKMLVAVVVAFFICWAPFHAQRLVSIYCLPKDSYPSPEIVGLYTAITYVSGVLYYLSTTINPIIYHIMSVKFREAFKETWCGGKGRRRYLILSRGGGGPANRSVTESGSRPPLDQDISNSSLRAVEAGALEAELTAYIGRIAKGSIS